MGLPAASATTGSRVHTEGIIVDLLYLANPISRSPSVIAFSLYLSRGLLRFSLSNFLPAKIDMLRCTIVLRKITVKYNYCLVKKTIIKLTLNFYIKIIALSVSF